MPFAARVLDPTNHPGTISGPGVPTVLINGSPASAAGDSHTCAMPTPSGPHPPSVILKGSTTVFIGGRPAARVGDAAGCGAQIVKGSLNVVIGG